jgi:hypothetical protein
MPTTTMKKSRRFQPSWRYARCPNMKPMASTLMRHSERKITWERVMVESVRAFTENSRRKMSWCLQRLEQENDARGPETRPRPALTGETRTQTHLENDADDVEGSLLLGVAVELQRVVEHHREAVARNRQQDKSVEPAERKTLFMEDTLRDRKTLFETRAKYPCRETKRTAGRSQREGPWYRRGRGRRGSRGGRNTRSMTTIKEWSWGLRGGARTTSTR